MTHFELETLLTNIPELIYMKDVEGKFVTGTKYSQDFFNMGIDMLNKLELDITSIKEIAGDDVNILNDNKAVSEEKEIYDTDGNTHYYSIYKAPINDIRKNPIGIIVIIKNIDNSRLLETQKNTFVASVGHDLKNPTIAQIRALELLLSGQFGAFNKEQKNILEMVLDSCRYMNGMLSSLLATYRTQCGVIKLNYGEFSLVSLTEECISEMLYVAKDKNLTISINNNSRNQQLFADKVQIKRVIMNLLSNSIKYAFKYSDININIYNNKNYTGFELENSSPYISPQKQEEIFSKYVSFAEKHKELGIGLGLYASQKIIQAHDGNIFVKSFKENRNIFGFEIPAEINDINKFRTVTF